MVVGDGIGGLAAARHLDRLLGRRRDVEITLVNRNNFFSSESAALRGVLRGARASLLRQPIRPCLRRARFIEATAQEIDVARRIVHVAGPDDGLRELPYDYVVRAPNAPALRPYQFALSIMLLRPACPAEGNPSSTPSAYSRVRASVA